MLVLQPSGVLEWRSPLLAHWRDVGQLQHSLRLSPWPRRSPAKDCLIYPEIFN